MDKPMKSTNEQFQKDLSEGQEFERKVQDLMLENYKGKLDVPEGNNYWDFQIGETKFEVKCDARASESGNLAFEWEYREKPSGVARFEPDVWVHGVGKQGCDGVYQGDMEKVRAGVIKLFYAGRARYMKFLGDGCSGFLVKIEDCQEFLTKIK